MIKGAIFDLDGTLLDSMPVWSHIDFEYLKSHGKEPHEDLSAKFKRMSMTQAAAYFQSEYGICDSIETIISDILNLIAQAYIEEIPLKDGATQMLEAFYKRNIPMCVATANNKKVVSAALKRTGVLDYFIDVLTCEDLKCDKNTPIIFEKACELLHTPKEETYVFEDSLHAVITAKNARFPVVAVFDEASQADRETLEKTADIYLETLSDWSAI